MNPIGYSIDLALKIFIGFLIVRLVVDWIQVFARSWQPTGVVLVLLEAVYSVTDPPILAFRRIFKPIRIGGVSLDLSFLAVLLVCYLLLAVNQAIWASA
ncbi:YggT family protein [Nocardioides marmorisolisilvae]|uniref:YggT family protein n=1 Tax=Nocardioides marmorisolisilvae TaxID=1542737 RepID=A0A3N0DVR9_9ACTN|nr:YggT family protein [Nocardioides marmorisolisilvae]RNL79717.1 YggT family protein [Nocardioides marmorisolisilvae]